MNRAIAERRLLNQRIARPEFRRPHDVIAWFGALQAQEFAAAKWALGLRLQDGAADADIERAFAQGRILRTHVMRPTWHFVTPADIRWLLELTAPHVHLAMSSYNRRLGLEPATFRRATSIFERALRDGQYLTRTELGDRLRRARLTVNNVRLAHLAMHAELEGVICSGPRRGKQLTDALIAERAPGALRLSRDEALAELSRRYFRSHGPATTRDFAWWSGLTVADAKRGLEMNRARREEADGRTYWTLGRAAPPATRNVLAHRLPVYDEYLIAYRDREAVPHGPSAIRSRANKPVTFQHALVIGGQVAGTWRAARNSRAIRIDVAPLRRLSALERDAVEDALARYQRFVGVPVKLSVR